MVLVPYIHEIPILAGKIIRDTKKPITFADAVYKNDLLNANCEI